MSVKIMGTELIEKVLASESIIQLGTSQDYITRINKLVFNKRQQNLKKKSFDGPSCLQGTF